jgi:peptidoglycan hydrolase CwlO-like protein
MDDTIIVEIPKVEAARVQAQIEAYLSRIRQTQQMMADEQTEMDRLKAETRQNLAEIKRLVA